MAVLIVADSPDALRSLQTLLQYLGQTEVVTAPSAEEALQVLGRPRKAGDAAAVEAVLLDADRPGNGGVEVCRQLTEAKLLQDVPVLLLTGESDEQALQKVLAGDAFDYIRKPVKHPEVLARLRAALKVRRDRGTSKAREHALVELAQQLKQLNHHLQRQSVRDEVTGLANRRHFEALLAREWARAARGVFPLALALIDLDFFRDYNAHYGREAGDQCLHTVASALLGQARRPGDQLARYGGGAFAVILSHTGRQGAAVVAEHLRTHVEDLGLPHVRSPVGSVSVSVGVATLVPERGQAADVLVTAAERALATAKSEGRNRVHAAADGVNAEPQGRRDAHAGNGSPDEIVA